MAPGLIALLFGGLAALLGGMSSGRSSDPETDGSDGADPATNGGAQPIEDDPTASWGGAAQPVNTVDTFGGDMSGTVVDADVLDWTGPSPEEQLIVELINRARMDPASEVARLSDDLASGVSSSPTAPLAITPELSASARAHSQDMDDRDFFAHTNPDGQSPGARAIEDGHGTGYVGENIGWIGSSRPPTDTQPRAEAHHANLWGSDGHQRNLMNDDWTEIGVGYDEGSYRGWNGSSFVTEVFSDRGFTYLTWVVIEDGDGDDFYDIGEGLGGVQVTAHDGTNTYATETWGSGGYALALSDGAYQVRFEGGALDAPIMHSVVIDGANVKLDVIEDSGTVTSSLVLPPAGNEAAAELSGLPAIPLADLPTDEEDDALQMDLLLA